MIPKVDVWRRCQQTELKEHYIFRQIITKLVIKLAVVPHSKIYVKTGIYVLIDLSG